MKGEKKKQKTLQTNYRVRETVIEKPCKNIKHGEEAK